MLCFGLASSLRDALAAARPDHISLAERSPVEAPCRCLALLPPHGLLPHGVGIPPSDGCAPQACSTRALPDLQLPCARPRHMVLCCPWPQLSSSLHGRAGAPSSSDACFLSLATTPSCSRCPCLFFLRAELHSWPCPGSPVRGLGPRLSLVGLAVSSTPDICARCRLAVLGSPVDSRRRRSPGVCCFCAAPSATSFTPGETAMILI
jgi:hypothetical protein